MRTTRRIHYPKAFYRPIEAAVRWSNLTRFESRILAVVKNGPLPDRNDFPRWPLLRLNTERIFDAVREGGVPEPITLRAGDYLRREAEALNAMLAALRARGTGQDRSRASD